MSTTSLRLQGAYLALCLHKFFGTTRPVPKYELTEGLGQIFPTTKPNIQGYFFLDKKTGMPKDYWVENLSDKEIILTTSLMAHGDLSGSKCKNFNTYQYNFNFEHIKILVDRLQNSPEYRDKAIHLIIPRVETGAHEDHIVVEYRQINVNQRAENSQDSLIIDSKPSPSGLLHNDIAERIHTEKQGFFNSEDCGYHVKQTIPALVGLLRNGTKIDSNALLPALNNDKEGSYATRIAIDKLHFLAELYDKRVNAYESEKKNQEYHSTFGLFKFGCSATDKRNAATKILGNIAANKTNIFKGLSKEELEAAKDSTLGKVVEEYQDSVHKQDSLLHPERSYATRVAIDKLHYLAELYERRVNAKDNNQEYHSTFGFFKFGCSATDKRNATNKILSNIEANKTNIFEGLSKKELEAANDSTLGKAVDEYQASVRKHHPLLQAAYRTV